MKEFNLEKALAGEPVVTRDGGQVKIAGYNQNAKIAIVGWLYRDKAWRHTGWSANGRYASDDYDSKYDLFMASVKREGWVNVYGDEAKRKVSYRVYTDRDDCYNAGKDLHDYITTIKIEWEE